MIPILWRYLLVRYLKVFFLCVASFIAILLTLRLSEIAHFATLGPELLSVFLFIAQQIPYVLPIAFPVSALISSLLLAQELSESKELTAMRSCGFSLKEILSPVIFGSLLLSLVNFYIVSEVSTTSHLATAQLKYKLRSMNPLLLINNKTLMRMQGLYVTILGGSRVGEFAEDLLFFYPGSHQDRFSLLVAKRVDVVENTFVGKDVTIITETALRSNKTGSSHCQGEGLILENMHSSKMSLSDFAKLLEKKIWSINNDHLSLAQLLIRQEEKGALHRTITEIIRRVSVAAAVFSFTLLGLSFGISISRSRSYRGLWIVIILSALYLISFFLGKSFDQALVTATLCYTLPHFVIWGASLIALSRIARGMEG